MSLAFISGQVSSAASAAALEEAVQFGFGGHVVPSVFHRSGGVFTSTAAPDSGNTPVSSRSPTLNHFPRRRSESASKVHYFTGRAGGFQ